MRPPKPQKQNSRPKLTAQQRHDAGVVRKPWTRNASMNTKDPRTIYAKFESWAIGTITYPVRGLKGLKYALTCVENHTRLTYTFLMKKKRRPTRSSPPSRPRPPGAQLHAQAHLL